MNPRLLNRLQLLLYSFFLVRVISAHADEMETYSPSKDDKEFFTPKEDKKKLKIKQTFVEGLPNVLLIGDSISVGYTPHVMNSLKGKANVVRIPQNGGDTERGLKNLDKWLGDQKWDLIHFNWGLHDLCYRHPQSKVQGRRDKKRGTQQIPLELYSKNLEQLVEQLKVKAPEAQLIWCATTFVPEEEAGRFQGDDHKYNAAAKAIMDKNGIAINDLHTFSQTIQEDAKGVGDVHFTNEGSKKLGQKVAEEIESLLKTPAK